MTQIKSFTDLEVWQKSQRLYAETLQDVKSLPKEPGLKHLIDQLLSSVTSISANIAEGFGSESTAEYCRFINIARKSANEAQNWFLTLGTAGRLQNVQARAKQCEEISRMLWGLRASLQARIAARNG